MRNCRTCNVHYSDFEFGKIKSTYISKNGTIQYLHYRLDCRECHAKKKYERFLLQKYNLTLSDYSNMVVAQNKRCAICGKDFTGREPYVDHNHETGKTRGLLCETCNFGLGQFKDNPALLLRAAEYLKAWLQVVPEGDSCNSPSLK